MKSKSRSTTTKRKSKFGVNSNQNPDQSSNENFNKNLIEFSKQIWINSGTKSEKNGLDLLQKWWKTHPETVDKIIDTKVEEYLAENPDIIVQAFRQILAEIGDKISDK